MYRDFSVDDRSQFDRVYGRNVKFQDPFHEISGADELYDYFVRLMARVKSCKFDIEVVAFENSYTEKSAGCQNEQAAILSWVMRMQHESLNKGKEVKLHGTTLVRFGKKITYHRDYFDSSEMLYRHLPVLGSVIRFIEKQV